MTDKATNTFAAIKGEKNKLMLWARKTFLHTEQHPIWMHELNLYLLYSCIGWGKWPADSEDITEKQIN